MVGDGLLLPFPFSLYTLILLSPFLSVFTFFIYVPNFFHFYFLSLVFFYSPIFLGVLWYM